MAEKKSIVYRRATAYDSVNIGRLIEEGLAKSGNKYPPVSPNKMMAWICRTIAVGYVVVADLNGRIVGSLGLGPYQYGWSEHWCVANEWMFVQPIYRERGTAEKLMELAALWCDSQNVPIIIGVQDIVDAELKDRFLSIKGFVYGGGIFLRWPEIELSDEIERDATVGNEAPAVG